MQDCRLCLDKLLKRFVPQPSSPMVTLGGETWAFWSNWDSQSSTRNIYPSPFLSVSVATSSCYQIQPQPAGSYGDILSHISPKTINFGEDRIKVIFGLGHSSQHHEQPHRPDQRREANGRKEERSKTRTLTHSAHKDSGITHSIATTLNPWHQRKASFRNWQNSTFQAEERGLGWLQNSLLVAYYTACSTSRRGKPSHNWRGLFYLSVYTFINT